MRRAGVVLLILGLPLTAVAQRITITPQVGLYAPLRDQGKWVDNTYDCENGCPIDLQTYRLDLKPGVDVGLKLVMEWDGMGLESFVSTAGLKRQAGYAGSERHPARNTVAGLRFTYRRPLSGRSDLTLGGGFPPRSSRALPIASMDSAASPIARSTESPRAPRSGLC